MTSRRQAVGVPVGVAATVLIAIVATVILRGGVGDKPTPLPLSLAGSGARNETASDAKMAGAPAGLGATYQFVGPVPDGLPDEGSAYRLADGKLDRDAVRRLAAVLGMTGEIATEPDALVVRDGQLVLRVSTTASRSWSYYREVVVPGCGTSAPAGAVDLPEQCDRGDGVAGICLEGADSPCNDTPETVDGGLSGSGAQTDEQKLAEEQKLADEKAREAASAGSAGSTGSTGSASSSSPVMSCPEPPPCPDNAKCAAPAIACGEPFAEPQQLPLPAESVAKALARKVFDATGLGESVRLRAERGFDAWYISGAIEIDGLEVIGFGQSVAIDTHGKIRDASGSLAVAELLDRYPLVSVEAGLARLEKQQSGFTTRELCAPGPAGTCGTGTPEKLEVTDVRLGLLYSPIWEDEKEKVFLVPAWIYDIKGRDYPDAVFAITDEYLAGVTPDQVDPGTDPGIEPLVDPPVQVDPVDPGSQQPTPKPAPQGPPPSEQPPPSGQPAPSEAPRPGGTEPDPSGSPEPAPAETVSAEPEPQPAQS